MLSASQNASINTIAANALDWQIEPTAKRRRLNDEYEAQEIQIIESANVENDTGISRAADLPGTSYSQRGRGNNTYGDATVSDQGQAVFGNQYQTNNYYNGQHDSPTQPESISERMKRLINSLTFKRMDARLHNIATALPKTCTWLYRHKAWKGWIDEEETRNHNGFLWIKGKPGCGKSTIIKGALNWANKNQAKRDWINISYFFNARAHGALEKSTIGLYRSLVHQMIQAIPKLSNILHEMFSWKSDQDEIDWTIVELQEFLVEVASSEDRPPVCIFIDALDEGDESEVRELISYFENLSGHAEGCPVVRICFSSRHYPLITIRTGLSLVVEKQKDHDHDIEIYVKSKITATSTAACDLNAAICMQSSGIFLWVVLVIPILNQLYDRGKSPQQLRNYLNRLPKDLEGLFAGILAREADEVRDCVSLLQWVLYASRPLSALELYLAVQHSWTRTKDDVVTIPNGDGVEKFLLYSSRGLVEVTKSQPPVLQFIHETVREFLIGEGGLAQVDQVLKDNLLGRSHAKLAQVCLAYMTCQRTDLTENYNPLPLSRLNPKHIPESLAFLEYAAQNVLRHAEQAQESHVAQLNLLDSMVKEYGKADLYYLSLYNTFEKHRIRRIRADTTLLYIVVVMQLPSLTRLLLQRGSPVNATCRSRYNNALQAACYRGNEEIVRSLLEAGADINQKGGEYKYALFAALKGKHYHLITAIGQMGGVLDVGTFVDLMHHDFTTTEHQDSLLVLLYHIKALPQPDWNSLLQLAMDAGMLRLFIPLILKGADVNTISMPQGMGRRSVIISACKMGDMNTLCQLLEQ